MHALNVIAATGATPMKAKPIAVQSYDDRMVGNMLANEVLAYAKTTTNKWREFAIRLIPMTVEARKVFVDAIKSQKAAMTKAQTEYGIDAEAAKKRTASFSVQVSELTTIANALNAGATVEGWRTFVNASIKDPAKHCESDASTLEHAGYDTLKAYARTLSTSKAGRRTDTLLVKLGKFIEAQRKLELNPDDAALMAELVSFYNERAK